jgi:hypothetical protein
MKPLRDSNEWVSMITDNEYAKQYPRINDLNVFSASTLAYEVQKQVDWKLKRSKVAWTSKTESAMFKGKAIHEYFQTRLRRRYADTLTELEVEMSFPYKWEHLPFSEFTIIGHIDAYIPNLGLLVEIKSSDYSGVISDFMRRQLGFYMVAWDRKSLDPCSEGLIVKVNDGVRLESLFRSDAIKWCSEVKSRGVECAKILDEWFATHVFEGRLREVVSETK